MRSEEEDDGEMRGGDQGRRSRACVACDVCGVRAELRERDPRERKEVATGVEVKNGQRGSRLEARVRWGWARLAVMGWSALPKHIFLFHKFLKLFGNVKKNSFMHQMNHKILLEK